MSSPRSLEVDTSRLYPDVVDPASSPSLSPSPGLSSAQQSRIASSSLDIADRDSTETQTLLQRSDHSRPPSPPLPGQALPAQSGAALPATVSHLPSELLSAVSQSSYIRWLPFRSIAAIVVLLIFSVVTWHSFFSASASSSPASSPRLPFAGGNPALPAWVHPLLTVPVCPTSSVDLRSLPHLPALSSASYLHQFRITEMFSFEQLLPPAARANFASSSASSSSWLFSSSFFPSPSFPFAFLNTSLPLWNLTRFTVHPSDAGLWFHVVPTAAGNTSAFSRHPEAATPRPTPGTRRAGSRSLIPEDDLTPLLPNIDWDDRRGPVWPHPALDQLPTTLSRAEGGDGSFWVFGEAHLLWQRCEEGQREPQWRDARTATMPDWVKPEDGKLPSPDPAALRFLLITISTNCAPGDRLREGAAYTSYIAMKQAYARLHGYDAITVCRRAHHNVELVQYEKINVVLDLFTRHRSEYDYLLWSDWDCVIFNSSTPLTAFLPAHLPDQAFTDHHFAINDGAFLMRTSERMLRFLQVWRYESFHYGDWGWADNGSFNHLLLTFLDRPPPFHQQCTRRNEGPPYPILFCTHLEWMEDLYGFVYWHRFGQYLHGVPAVVGFNNHPRNMAMVSWGWMTSSQWQPERGMFMSHDKDERTAGQRSQQLNHWQFLQQDYIVDRIVQNTNAKSNSSVQ